MHRPAGQKLRSSPRRQLFQRCEARDQINHLLLAQLGIQSLGHDRYFARDKGIDIPARDADLASVAVGSGLNGLTHTTRCRKELTAWRQGARLSDRILPSQQVGEVDGIVPSS